MSENYFINLIITYIYVYIHVRKESAMIKLSTCAIKSCETFQKSNLTKRVRLETLNCNMIRFTIFM